MAEAFIVWVIDLITEFLAHALVFLLFLETAWAVTSRTFEAFLNGVDDFLVWIQCNLHGLSSSCCQNVLFVLADWLKNVAVLGNIS